MDGHAYLGSKTMHGYIKILSIFNKLLSAKFAFSRVSSIVNVEELWVLVVGLVVACPSAATGLTGQQM